MKTTMKIYEIQNLFNLYTSPSFFYNDVNVKVSDTLYMKMEANKDKLIEKIQIADKAQTRLYEELVKNNKAERIGKDNTQIKVNEDAIPEVQERLTDILNDEFDIDFETINKSEFDKALAGCDLSVPERRLINIYTGGEKHE